MTIDSYTIPVPTLWAIGVGLKSYGNTALSTSTQFPALDACRVVVDGNTSPATTNAQANDMTATGKAWRQKYLYRRDELTNSIYVNTGENTSSFYAPSFFSLDVDGTFMGEWGYVYGYAGSGWVAGAYSWTAEAWSPVYQFVVNADGGVAYGFPFTSIVTVCRG